MVNGLLGAIDPQTMPITYGLLAQRAAMPEQQASGFAGLANNPYLAAGAALLQASGQGQTTGQGIGLGLSAFSEALAGAERLKAQQREAQLKELKTAISLDRTMGGGFQGNGLSQQLANMQAQRYIQAGYSPQEAYYRAGREVAAATPTYTQDVATGQLIAVPRPSIPYVETGMGAPQMPSPPLSVPSVPATAPAPVTAPPQQPPMPTGQPAMDAFTSYLNSYSGQPQAAPFAQPAIETDIIPVAPSNNLSPIEQRTQSETMIRQGAEKLKTFEDAAVNADSALANAENALTVLDSGFKGGMTTELKAQWQKLKSKDNPTDEERKFLQDYATMERYTGDKVIEFFNNLKGAISEGERSFALGLAAAPSQNSETIRTKIMLDYVGAEAAKRKRDFAQQWTASYGNLSKQNETGETFEQAYSNIAESRPLITPEVAQRFGAIYYITPKTDLETLPPGLKVYNTQSRKFGVIE